ncbi:MAG: exodeoxyribonuclease VII small subunit [Planctomycetota bacterium]|nr:exodeoxyribonuclease VII small subunit [Planctomycetota bacterium]
MAKKADAEPGFDGKLEELETIVAELEEGGLGLEPAIERYQKGIELLKQCHVTLEGYKKRVEELTRGAEGVLEPFEGEPDLDPDLNDPDLNDKE